MVVSQSAIASEVGAQVLRDGGNAVDAAVATAFALAVTHPTAGNIGGGGFLVWRPASGEPLAYDFREKAPAAAHPEMWLDENGEYSFQIHHLSHKAVGVPGTVAGLHLAWEQQGSVPWERLVRPAVGAPPATASGSPHGLAGSLARVLERMAPYPGLGGAVLEGGHALRTRRDPPPARPGRQPRADPGERGRRGFTRAGPPSCWPRRWPRTTGSSLSRT